MVKEQQKASSKTKVSKNAHLQSRVDYLHKAAQYLSESKKNKTNNGDNLDSICPAGDPVQNAREETKHTLNEQQGTGPENGQKNRNGTPSYLVNQARSVALKSQIRLSQETKRSVCKRCDTPLIPGKTSSTHIENLSKGKKKPWAEVLVVTCLACACQKRFPVGAPRQIKKRARQDAAAQIISDGASVMPEGDDHSKG